MIMIREAVDTDIPAIVRMGLRFAGSVYAPFLAATPAALSDFAGRLIDAEDSTIFVSVTPIGALDGMLAVIVYPHPMSGERVAAELCWWIEPESRGGRCALKLLRKAEQWADDHEAQIVQMIAPTERVGQFYETLGYGRVETTYQRRLS